MHVSFKFLRNTILEGMHNMFRLYGFFGVVFVSLILSFCAAAQEKQPTILALLGPEEPIRTSGHGHMIGKGGKILELSEQDLLAAQDRYIKVMYKHASKRGQKHADQELKRIGQLERGSYEHVASQALLLYVLTETGPAGDKYRMHMRNKSILHRLRPLDKNGKPWLKAFFKKLRGGFFETDRDPITDIAIYDGSDFLDAYDGLPAMMMAGQPICINALIKACPSPPISPNPVGYMRVKQVVFWEPALCWGINQVLPKASALDCRALLMVATAHLMVATAHLGSFQSPVLHINQGVPAFGINAMWYTREPTYQPQLGSTLLI